MLIMMSGMFFVATGSLIDGLIVNDIELLDTVFYPVSINTSQYDSFLRVGIFEFVQLIGVVIVIQRRVIVNIVDIKVVINYTI